MSLSVLLLSKNFCSRRTISAVFLEKYVLPLGSKLPFHQKGCKKFYLSVPISTFLTGKPPLPFYEKQQIRALFPVSNVEYFYTKRLHFTFTSRNVAYLRKYMTNTCTAFWRPKCFTPGETKWVIWLWLSRMYMGQIASHAKVWTKLIYSYIYTYNFFNPI